MALVLKQSTAVDVLIGPFLDLSDGFTEETGESPSVVLSKNGQALGAKNDATTPVHDASGYHNCELDATDTNTVGTLVLAVANTAQARGVTHEYQIVEEDTFTWMFASGAAPDTQVAAIKTDTAAISTMQDALVLTSATIETVTSQTAFVIPATADATDNGAYHGATAVFIDGSDPNQKSIRLVTDYTASSRTIEVQSAPDFTITTADTITILTCAYTEGIWDQILTGSTHNIATSAGRRLRQVEQATVLASGQINTFTNSHTVTLDTGAVATAEYYHGARLTIIEGAGAGQSRIISHYTSGRVVTLDSDFVTDPDNASLYEIDTADVHVSVMDSDLAAGFVATATSTTQITLDDIEAVATTDYYKNELIVFTHGTGAGQARQITGYTSGRVVTMSPALTTAVNTDTVWHIQAILHADEAAISELSQGIPTATPTVRTALMLMYMALRNKLDVATSGTDTLEVHNDAGTRIAQKLLTDDGSDYSEAKMSSGA